MSNVLLTSFYAVPMMDGAIYKDVIVDFVDIVVLCHFIADISTNGNMYDFL